jgi:hypothetical protein
MKRVTVSALALLMLAVAPQAQESGSYKLDEHTFNAGGNPAGGTVLTSTNYRITLDAVGDSVTGRNLSSNSYRMDGGFAQSYPPPGEVLGLLFTDKLTLVWDPEKSVGDYNLYRGLLSDLVGLGYGSCEQWNIATATTTDTDPVPAADGFFYLVTAENRLDEEGPKGFKSGSIPREGNWCP